VSIGGKTGSSPNDIEQPQAVFIGHAPYDNPRYLVYVIVEGVGKGKNHGSQYAAPVVKEILEYLL
jgi:cell division protein FtsI/penicillin-binding protein 2